MSSTDASPSTVVASRSPAHPDGWSQADRDAAAVEAIKINGRYMSDEYSQAVDDLHAFKSACVARGVDYADAFLYGDMTAEEYKKVDNARRHLMTFWKDVRILYKACKLTASDGGDFFSPDKRWLRLGNEYRVLVEPLDTANWYKAGNHLKGSGDYIDHVNKTEEKTKRPSQYAFLDRLMRDAGGYYVYSLQKAEEYALKRNSGNLRMIHKLEDARKDPPQGFLRPIRSLQIPVLEKTETGQTHPGDSSKDYPTGSKLSPVGVLDPKDSTPPPTPSVPGFENLSLAPKVDNEVGLASVPPGWKTGIRYRSISGQFKAPRRPLPEPTYGPNNERMIPAGAKWSKNSKAEEIQVDYNAIVYKTENKKYLVVRAKIFTNVELVHESERQCGYFQESLKFSMHVPGDVIHSPGTLPLPGSDGEIEIKVNEKQGTTTTLGATASVQGSKAGPSGGVGISAGRTWAREKAEELAYKDKRVGLAFKTESGKLVWTWTVTRMANGLLYADRAVKVSENKRLSGLSTFARTSSLLEVQGTWSFPPDKEEVVTLEAHVGQTLRYDAALDRAIMRGGGVQLETCVNRPDESGVLREIPLELPEESLKVNDQGARLPDPEQ